MPSLALDAIDRRIVAALQRDARLTNVELAAAVGLSPSPCLRRVRLLEEAGVITGYRAVVDRKAIGLRLTVFVGIKVDRHDDAHATAFREAVAAMGEVVACHLVSGDSDFLLQIVLPDLAAYERLLLDRLLKLPGVKDIRSTFVLNTVASERPLPLGHLAGG